MGKSIEQLRREAVSDDNEFTPLADKRVLIIDPADASRQILRDLVSGLGCRAFVNAGTYGEAMKVLQKGVVGVDLIFCEYNLRGPRDGQQLLEELRSRRVISMATGFVMVTGEAGYRRVVAAAEFAPDDYMIKPFSAENLRFRLLRLLDKKRVLGPVYALIDAGDHDQAVREAMRTSKEVPRCADDCLRLAIDVLHEAGRVEEAELLLRRVAGLNATPWAHLRLAGVRVSQGRLQEAEQMLVTTIAGNREMLRAYDALAEVKARLGKQDEALAVLEQASQLSELNVTRMRKLGAMAESLGRHDRAEQAYSVVLTRVRDSAMLAPEDYANLSRALVTQGKLDEAEKIAADQKRMMRGHRDSELTAALLEFQRTTRAGDTPRAQAALDKITQIEAEDAAAELSPRLLVQVVRVCFDFNKPEIAYAVAGRLARRPGVDPEVLAEIRFLLDQHRDEQKRTAELLDLHGIAQAIAHLVKNGYDAVLAARIARSLAHLQAQGEAGDDLATLAAAAEGVRRKYGVLS